MSSRCLGRPDITRTRGLEAAAAACWLGGVWLGPGAVGGAGADGVLVEALAEVQALEEQLDGGGDGGGRLVAAGELGDGLAERGLLLEQRDVLGRGDVLARRGSPRPPRRR